MAKASVIKFDEAPTVDRGGGIRSTPLVGKAWGEAGSFTTGVSRFPKGTAIPVHTHNCDEQVTILDGDAEVEIEGARTALRPYDTTFVPAGVPHRFLNVGDGPMAILWIYGAEHVTRTFVETGETAEHLSARDTIGS